MTAVSMQLPRMLLRPVSAADAASTADKGDEPVSYVVSAVQALTIGYSAACDVMLPSSLSTDSTTMDIVATLCYDADYHTAVLYLTSIYVPVYVNTTRLLRQGLPVPLQPGWTLRFGAAAPPSGQPLATPLLTQCSYTLEWPPRPFVPPLQLAALIPANTPPQDTYKVRAATSSWDDEDGDATAGELGTQLTLTSVKWAVMIAAGGPLRLSICDAVTAQQPSRSRSDRACEAPAVVSSVFSVSQDAFSDKPAAAVVPTTTPSMMDEDEEEYTEDDTTWEDTSTFSTPPSGRTSDEGKSGDAGASRSAVGPAVGRSGTVHRARWRPVGTELFDSHGAIRGLWTPHMVSPAPWSSQAGRCPTLDSSWPAAAACAASGPTQTAASTALVPVATATTQLRTERDWLFMDIESVCIVPYVLQRSYSRARLRPLMCMSAILSAPQRGSCGTGAARRRASLGSSTANVPPSGYATTATLRVFRRRRHEDRAAGLCCGLQSAPVRAACRVLSLLESHYDAGSDAFLPFRAKQRDGLMDDFAILSELLIARLELVPSVIHLSAPLFCTGDVHGSYADVCTILDMAVPLRHWSLMTTPLLFLGDYVDRGAHSVQVILLLFAWAVLCPRQLHLLRGNHEDPLVNGDDEVYGASCFRARCAQCLGPDAGDVFWRRSNEVFARLPIAATIDGVIFACHGGVPLLRDEVRQEDAADKDETPLVSMMQDLLAQRYAPHHFRFDALAPAATDCVDVARRRRLVRELLWNDPVPQTTLHNDADAHNNSRSNGSTRQELACHFRRNMYRGDCEGVIREFDAVALHDFLARFRFALLLRAHQQQRRGLHVAHHGRIITLFSCCDEAAGAGQVGCAGACYITAQDEMHLLSWHSHAGGRRHHDCACCAGEDETADAVADPPTRVPHCRPPARGGRAALEAQNATHDGPCHPASSPCAEPASRDDSMPRWKLLVQSSSARSAECCG